jgi:hypothetical protein
MDLTNEELIKKFEQHMEEIVLHGDDDAYEHIRWNEGDRVAVCGKPIPEHPREDLLHDEWLPDDPRAVCSCGKPTCPRCVEGAMAFDQLDDS